MKCTVIVSRVLLIIFVASSFVLADIRLPSIIGDNMVLQQDAEVAIWGLAQPGEKVTVKVQWQVAMVFTEAGSNGEWMVKVKTPKAEVGKSYTMIIRGNNTIKLENILVGEVWVCSGQSNMEMSVVGAENGKDEVAKATYPNIRLFKVIRNTSAKPMDDCQGNWDECSAETVERFSAVGYYFGKKLHKELDVPIGLIQSAWGGTKVEAWTPQGYFDKNEIFKELLDSYKKDESQRPQNELRYEQLLNNWEKRKKEAIVKSESEPIKPSKPQALRFYHYPCYLYNAMINPLVPFGVKGAIWYQGESNVGRADEYKVMFPLLIESWRTQWDIGEFPFYYVQIAPWDYRIEYSCPQLQEAQLQTMKSVDNCGMVVINDIGNVENIHPKNKYDVGERLASWALAKDYGYDNIVCSGPVYKTMAVEGSSIRIFFDYTADKLKSKDGELREFIIAGKDRLFHPVKAIIEGDTVIVSSDKVAEPLAVRFGWLNKSQPNLFNDADLPASPFRTDNW